MIDMLKNVIEWVARTFSKDASKMLIWTGVAGWTLSSLAQITAVVVNPKISNEQKSFLIPQEFWDAVVNVGCFFLITQATKKTVTKLFKTGKFAPDSVRKFINKHSDIYEKKVGNLDFDLDKVKKLHTDFPTDEYHACKNFATTLATVAAGVLSSNIVTPIIRNAMASRVQKRYIVNKQKTQIDKPAENKSQLNNNQTFRAYHSGSMRI